MANPRLLWSYSAARACRCPRTSSTGSSSAVASDISVTGSSMTINTASIAARAPTAQSLMSNATCSCGISVGTSLNWVHRLLVLHVVLVDRDLVVVHVIFGGLVELITDPDLAVVLTSPLNHQLSERLALVEDEYRLVEQLQECQEARDDHQGAVGIGDQRPEGAGA